MWLLLNGRSSLLTAPGLEVNSQSPAPGPLPSLNVLPLSPENAEEQVGSAPLQCRGLVMLWNRTMTRAWALRGVSLESRFSSSVY